MKEREIKMIIEKSIMSGHHASLLIGWAILIDQDAEKLQRLGDRPNWNKMLTERINSSEIEISKILSLYNL